MDLNKSNFANILYEVCEELDISIESFSYYWAHRLKKGDKTRYIVGYQFPLNTSSVKEICQDKVLTYGILNDSSVPAMTHIFLPNNIASTGLDREDHERLAEMMLNIYGCIVIKDNYGTGGNKVFKVTDMEEFEKVLDTIYQSSYAASLSPYYDIENEYRVVMLKGEPELVIRKDRPFILNEKGEKVYQNWKHNLGQGAIGVILPDSEIPEEVKKLAVRAVSVLGAGFVSVDVVKVKDGYMVMEVNGGVMMEHLAGQSYDYYNRAKNVYRKAVTAMFEEE